MKTIPLLDLHRCAIRQCITNDYIRVKAVGFLVKSTISEINIASILEIGAFCNQVRITTHIIGCAIDSTSWSFHNVNGLNRIKINGHTITINRMSTAHTIDHEIRFLTTEIRRCRSTKIRLCVGR